MVFASIVEWFCYFLGYSCIMAVILKVLGHFKPAVFFLPCAQSVAILKREEGERNGVTEDGKTWDNEQGNIFVLVFLLEEPIFCLYHF